jgi:hypothetical protein
MITDHDSLLDALLGKFQVFLLNRYDDDRLGFDNQTIRVFLPDLHWISEADMQKFPKYRFNGMDLLPQLFSALENVSSCEIYQTGDRLDFWRASVPKHSTPEATLEAILADPKIRDLHDRLQAFEPTVLRGNHDRWVAKITAEGTHPEVTTDATGRIFLTHGHIWDQIERLPDTWKAWAVSLAKNVTGRNVSVGPLRPKTVDQIKLKLRIRRSHPGQAMPLIIKTVGAIPLTKTRDVYAVENAYLPVDELEIASLDSAFDDFHDVDGLVAFGGDVRERARLEGACRLFVIGHTHQARILVDRHPQGGPLVTMDCGAWIENCTVQGGKPMPSAQFGVQCGNDVRVYQLGAAS